MKAQLMHQLYDSGLMSKRVERIEAKVQKDHSGADSRPMGSPAPTRVPNRPLHLRLRSPRSSAQFIKILRCGRAANNL